MALRRGPIVLAAVIVIAILGVLAYQFGAVALVTGGADAATVTITDERGETLATVDAEVADTPNERYTGLSDHESLSNDEGMLFVFNSESTRSFVMRDMAFPIDMIFVDANGEITTIHEAPVENGSDRTNYRGEAQWVLEVNYGYAAEHGIEEGDRIEIEYR